MRVTVRKAVDVAREVWNVSRGSGSKSLSDVKDECDEVLDETYGMVYPNWSLQP